MFERSFNFKLPRQSFSLFTLSSLDSPVPEFRVGKPPTCDATTKPAWQCHEQRERCTHFKIVITFAHFVRNQNDMTDLQSHWAWSCTAIYDFKNLYPLFATYWSVHLLSEWVVRCRCPAESKQTNARGGREKCAWADGGQLSKEVMQATSNKVRVSCIELFLVRRFKCIHWWS